MPDPALVFTTSQFVTALQLLRFQADDPSYYEMSQRARDAGHDVPASTLRDACSVPNRLPAKRTVYAFLAACGVGKKEQEAWDGAWKRARWAGNHARNVNLRRCTIRQWAILAIVCAAVVAVITYLLPMWILGHTSPADLAASRQATRLCESGTLLLQGSTAFTPVAVTMAVKYQTSCNGALIAVSGDGSRAGLQAVAAAGHAGAASTIGMSDGWAPDAAPYSALAGTPVAIVMYSMVVNQDVGIHSLSTSELKAIYRGDSTNWDQLGGPDLPIRIVSRNLESGTRATFERWVLGNSEGPASSSNCMTEDLGTRAHAIRCEKSSTESVLDAVSSTPGAIGYAETSAASAHQGIIQTSLNGFRPAASRIAGQDGYAFWTAEHFYTYGSPAYHSLAAGFLRYLLSLPARQLLRAQGFVPCSDVPILCAMR